MEYVTTTSGAKKIALHGINHWLDWYYYSQPMSISNRKICEDRLGRLAMLKMEPLEIGN